MEEATRDAIVERLADAAVAVELAVGARPDVARALAERGVDVTATDVRQREVPDGVAFVLDDLLDPDLDVYRGADVLYAQNLPAELQRPAREIAVAVDAPLYFTTLGTEEPVVPVDRRSIPGETLYRLTRES